jgi:putative transposase
MGQSLVKNYLHIVFSTKHRQPLILPSLETSLHSYIGGICNKQECYPVKVGGYTDHIHVLCLLSYAKIRRALPWVGVFSLSGLVRVYF